MKDDKAAASSQLAAESSSWPWQAWRPGEATSLLPTQPSSVGPEPAVRSLPADVVGLHVIRFAAALDVVAFHYAPLPGGDTMVPFFFMLSGFGPVYAALRRGGMDGDEVKLSEYSSAIPRAFTLARRLASVYPTHAFSLLLSVVAGLPLPLSAGVSLTLQFLLLDNWIPSALYKPSWYNKPSWYVSTLAFFWLLEPLAGRAAIACYRRRSHPTLWVLALTAAWVVVNPYLYFPLVWSQFSVTLGLFPILTYVHLYFIGACVAAAVHTRAAAGCTPVPYAASISLVLLVAALVVLARYAPLEAGTEWFGVYLSLFKQVSVLSPLHAMLIVGLAEGDDPLCRPLSAWPLPNTGRYALSVYLLQEPVWLLLEALGWRSSFSDAAWFAFFLAVLVAAAMLVQHLVQEPLQRAFITLLGRCGDGQARSTS